MPDLVTTQTFSDGEKGITATKLNNIVADAAIQPSFYNSKPSSPTLDPTDVLLELKGSGAYAQITGAQLVNSVALQVPVIPAGVVLDWAGAAAPSGWLLCDGSAVSRTTYVALYTALGGVTSPWGQGDGSTTFNLPDLRGRVSVGAGQGSGLTNRAPASTGGEETHVLAGAELAYHSHDLQNHTHTGADHVHGMPNHIHNIGAPIHHGSISVGTAGQGPFDFLFTANSGSAWITGDTTAAGSGPTGLADRLLTTAGPSTNNSGPTGSNIGHNNMPPFAVLGRIIKT